MVQGALGDRQVQPDELTFPAADACGAVSHAWAARRDAPTVVICQQTQRATLSYLSRMARRSNPVSNKRKRLPYVAKIKRDDPFRLQDEREIAQACRRIAAAGDYLALAGWREESGYRLYHFATWAKARAMQHWIDRSGIAQRPMPKLGLTAEEKAERDRQALAWGLETGAAREILQSYRRARDRGDSELTSFNAAAATAVALGRPRGECENTVRVLISWAIEHRRRWFTADEDTGGAFDRP
jgi:hypothetical protein